MDEDFLDREIQKAFNDTVGAVLSYLDEADVKSSVKQAVKSKLYELCDRKIKPLLEGQGNGQDDSRGNR